MTKKIYIFTMVLFAVFFIALKTEKAQAANENCICSKGSYVPFYYPRDGAFNVSGNEQCKTSCMSVADAKYYSYSDVANLGYQRIYNCLCVNGSNIPFKYPLNSKFSVSDDDTCHQKCADQGSKYYSFSNFVNLGTTLVTKRASNATGTSTGNTFETASDRVTGSTTADSSKGLIKCGRAGQRMCHLCDLIVGLNTIIKYIFSISIVVALTVIVVGSIFYIISAGDKKDIESAKGAIKNAVIGMVIVLSAWLIVNYSMKLLQTKSNLGISQVSGWSNFTCN
jgi:cbb3-type cytochrome oxidase subunit 3